MGNENNGSIFYFTPEGLIDGYKLDHRRQYPKGTQAVYSNWTPRTSRVEGQEEVFFFGLQYFLQKYLVEDWNANFFYMDVELVCRQYQRKINNYLGPNQIGTDHIRALHQLGYLPLSFRAVPEGTAVLLRIPMVTVENTHPDFAWLVNYFETIMSSVLWMPCTSATTASRMRRLMNRAAKMTGTPIKGVQWQGHDFSFRGMPGPEAAALSGAGHLLFFTGTDTLPAIELIEDYYPCKKDYLIGGSVPATEHSVMCAGGEENELETFERLLNLYPSGIVSIVSDTWDLWKVLTKILPTLKDKIMSRDGKLVIRPDSGDPIKIICGDPTAPVGSPAYKGVVELLWDVFGGTTTTGGYPKNGYKLLDSHIGCIYGDSITYERASAILAGLMAKGFASGNIVFGIGSFNYQFVTRDTYGFAMKATQVNINGQWIDIFKKPVTDNGMKNSAKGRLAVVMDKETGKMKLINQATFEQEQQSLLREVWRNGYFAIHESFQDIRERALNSIREA